MKELFEKMRAESSFEEVLVAAWRLKKLLKPKPHSRLNLKCTSKKGQLRILLWNRWRTSHRPKKSIYNPFLFLLIALLNSLGERFSQLSSHNDVFGFIYNVKNEDKNILLKKMCRLMTAFTEIPSTHLHPRTSSTSESVTWRLW